MDRGQVHYELFVRRQVGAAWVLDQASEDRGAVLEAAEDLMTAGKVVAVKVCKETLNSETGEFAAVNIFTKGAAETAKPKPPKEQVEPLCVSPQDLYSGHSRDRISRLLENWLLRNRATTFELLHRADLVEKLEASGVELQHAVQKIAIPEAQARGVTVHSLIRSFQGLIERAIERVLRDARKGVFPNLSQEPFAAAALRVMNESEPAYLLGGAVAGHLAPARTWGDKIGRLLDLADAAPNEPAARTLAFQVLEQPLAEVLGSKTGLADLLGPDLDLGGSLAAMTRLAAVKSVEMLIGLEPAVARMMPPLEGAALRLGQWLEAGQFEAVRVAVARNVLKELNGPRRLRPSDPTAEIELLRALAMTLSASAGQGIALDDVQAAFAVRSRMLVTGEFVEAFLGDDRTPRSEAESLVWLVENVTGGANKRQAARWLSASVGSLAYEKDVRFGPDSAAAKLAMLAALQRSASRAGLVEEDLRPILTKLGDLGGQVEAEAKLTAAVSKAKAPAVHRLTLLLRLATGDAGPVGPSADRAKAEALKMLRSPDTRAELAETPGDLKRVRDLVQAAGLAA